MEQMGIGRTRPSFAAIPYALVDDESISVQAKVVYMVLERHANYETRRTFVGKDRIAAKCGMKKATSIDPYLKELRSTGWVSSVKRWKQKMAHPNPVTGDWYQYQYQPGKGWEQATTLYTVHDRIEPRHMGGGSPVADAGGSPVADAGGSPVADAGGSPVADPNKKKLNENQVNPPVVPPRGDAADAALAKEIAGEVIEESTDGQVALFDDQPGTEVATIDDRAPVEPSPAEKPAKKTTRGARLPEGWMPAPASIQRIHELFPGVSRRFLELEHETFCNYWAGVPGAKGLKLDWEGTWRNWLTKALRETPPARWQDPASPAAVPVVSPKIQGYADALQQVKAQYAAERARGGVDV